MMLKHSKIKFFLCFLPILVFPSVVMAVGQKTETIWGHTLQYQLVFLSDRAKTYDGLSFMTPRGKEQIGRVIINTVNFEKEALEVWNDFESSGKPPEEMAVSFFALASRLSSHNPPQKTELLKDLRLLKLKLQYAAWYPVYEKARASSAQPSKARKAFVKNFKDVRTRTIEFHEVSHLLDFVTQENSRPKSFSGFHPSFGRMSETAAFITELAYGANPADSLWQGIAGVIDELNQGRDIDSSLAKVRLVLEEGSKFLSPSRKGSVSCLCSLLRLHAQNWALSFRKKIFDGKIFAFSGEVNSL